MDELTPEAVLEVLDRELASHLSDLPRLVRDASSAPQEIGYSIVEALTLHREGESGAAVSLLMRDVPAQRLVSSLLALLNAVMKRADMDPADMAVRLQTLE